MIHKFKTENKRKEVKGLWSNVGDSLATGEEITIMTLQKNYKTVISILFQTDIIIKNKS